MLANQIKQALLALETCSVEYDGLSEDDKRKTRSLVYQQAGAFGHIFFKTGLLSPEKPLIETILDTRDAIAAKKAEKALEQSGL